MYILNESEHLAAIVAPRHGVEELLARLQTEGVPVLVFSAGMGDILMQVLDKHNVTSDNVKVVSNFFKYDDKVCG